MPKIAGDAVVGPLVGGSVFHWRDVPPGVAIEWPPSRRRTICERAAGGLELRAQPASSVVTPPPPTSPRSSGDDREAERDAGERGDDRQRPPATSASLDVGGAASAP